MIFKYIIPLIIIFLALIILIINNKIGFSDSGALIQLATSSPVYFPVLSQTYNYPWLTNISTRDPLYRYPYTPFIMREIVDMDKVQPYST
jgi:hypothetical protein